MPTKTTKKTVAKPTAKTKKDKPEKKTAKKATQKAEVQPKVKKNRTYPYIFATGRRKSAVARVRLYKKDSRGGIIVNEKDYKEYFPYFEYNQIVEEPLKKVDLFGKNFISVKVQGGGPKSQAEAVRHGIARTLLKFDEELKKTLRSEGWLTRDSRKKERKKPGLKRARRAPQWAKR